MALIKGRGTAMMPPNRFERLHLVERHGEVEEGETANPRTELYRDTTKSVLSENDSPDIQFRFGLNPYRGCEHGCVYCYARPSHEYLSFNAGLDFETRITVKENAPALLRARFLSPRWQPEVVALSGNTDCYQPCERDLCITRRCLKVFRDFLNPVGIITKSTLVCRDVDLLLPLAAVGAVQVHISITSLDPELARNMEPRAASPARRLATIEHLSAAGIPVGVMVAPIVPGLNDHEIPRIIERAASAGANCAGWTMLRLASPVDQLFDDWLAQHYPDRRNRILHRIRECRSEAISDSRFGQRMRGEGAYAMQIAALYSSSVRCCGLDKALPPPSIAAFRRPPQTGDQLSFFDG